MGPLRRPGLLRAHHRPGRLHGQLRARGGAAPPDASRSSTSTRRSSSCWPGYGSTVVWLPDGRKRTFEWGPKALFAIPLNCQYQIFNGSGSEPVRLSVHQRRAADDQPVPQPRLRLRQRLRVPRAGRRRQVLRRRGRAPRFTQDVGQGTEHLGDQLRPRPDELQALRARGARQGLDERRFVLADGTMHAHVSQMPVGRYKKAHRHAAGTHVHAVDGDGLLAALVRGRLGVRRAALAARDHVHAAVLDVPPALQHRRPARALPGLQPRQPALPVHRAAPQERRGRRARPRSPRAAGRSSTRSRTRGCTASSSRSCAKTGVPSQMGDIFDEDAILALPEEPADRGDPDPRLDRARASDRGHARRGLRPRARAGLTDEDAGPRSRAAILRAGHARAAHRRHRHRQLDLAPAVRAGCSSGARRTTCPAGSPSSTARWSGSPRSCSRRSAPTARSTRTSCGHFVAALLPRTRAHRPRRRQRRGHPHRRGDQADERPGHRRDLRQPVRASSSAPPPGTSWRACWRRTAPARPQLSRQRDALRRCTSTSAAAPRSSRSIDRGEIRRRRGVRRRWPAARRRTARGRGPGSTTPPALVADELGLGTTPADAGRPGGARGRSPSGWPTSSSTRSSGRRSTTWAGRSSSPTRSTRTVAPDVPHVLRRRVGVRLRPRDARLRRHRAASWRPRSSSGWASACRFPSLDAGPADPRHRDRRLAVHRPGQRQDHPPGGPDALPVHNVPVVHLGSRVAGRDRPGAVAAPSRGAPSGRTATRLELLALAFTWTGLPTYERLAAMARGIVEAAAPAGDDDRSWCS